MQFIGRKDAIDELDRICDADRPQFLVVYGRRRVGKTYLVRQYFKNEFAFYATGVLNGSARDELAAFGNNLRLYGGEEGAPQGWFDAFAALVRLLERDDVRRDPVSGKRVVFIDEMPWLDTPRSDFLPALDWFWNAWGSAQEDVVLVVCGSATSWIVKKLFKNRGGLHNRVTARIRLEPFTLGECAEYFRTGGFAWEAVQVLEAYMVFGGIPYYLDLLNRRVGLAQNIDNLCFRRGGQLADEFDELYRSLFRNAERHLAIVRSLAGKKAGCTREELLGAAGGATGGTLTNTLKELEQCGFIRSYRPFGRRSRGTLYQLIDPFSLFYLQFVDARASDRFWQENYQSPRLNAWRGYAFELICLIHVRQIRHALGISAISADVSSWRSAEADSGAQIDLVIDRADRIIDLCEMKWSSAEFVIDKAYDRKLRERREAFLRETKSRKGARLVLVTPYGVRRNAYSGTVQAEVTAEDLFA